MKLSKEVFLLILAGLLLTVIFVGVFLIFKEPTTDKAVPPTPTPTESSSFDKYPVTYNDKASQKAWSLVENKTQLSAQDAQAKKLLINENSNTSGVVHQTNLIEVIYTPTFDMFQATILTTNINEAKQETVSWFKSYGLSQEGICNLPLIFSIDFFVAQSLKGQNITFNPLPPGCE